MQALKYMSKSYKLYIYMITYYKWLYMYKVCDTAKNHQVLLRLANFGHE